MNIEMKDFLDKYGISSNKLQTEDGYFIIDKSIADICKEAGVETKFFDYEGYDDWYITGLKKDDNNIVYSMINQHNMVKNHGAVYMKPKRIIGIVAKILNGVNVTQNESTI